jgi:hypothetical protein
MLVRQELTAKAANRIPAQLTGIEAGLCRLLKV